MGFDPVTIGLGISAASGIYGAISSHRNQKKAQQQTDQNFGAQQQAYGDSQNALNQKNQMLQGLVLPMLNGSGYNTGQDGMMQQLRGLPDGRFDTSGYFDSIRKLSNQDTNDQVSGLHGSAGSLGQRFGTGMMNAEAQLRSRATVGLGAQYGQIGQQAYDSFQNRQISRQQLGQNNMLGLLGILSGQQTSGGIPIPQRQVLQGGTPGSDALGNLGNLALLYPYLRGGGGNSHPNITNSGLAPNINTNGIPSSLFGGVRY